MKYAVTEGNRRQLELLLARVRSLDIVERCEVEDGVVTLEVAGAMIALREEAALELLLTFLPPLLPPEGAGEA